MGAGRPVRCRHEGIIRRRPAGNTGQRGARELNGAQGRYRPTSAVSQVPGINAASDPILDISVGLALAVYRRQKTCRLRPVSEPARADSVGERLRNLHHGLGLSQEQLARRLRAFLAGTPGIELSTGFRQSLRTPGTAGGEFVLRRIGGVGHGWVELSGDVVRRDLPAGVCLLTHPWHIGMSDASVAVQITELEEPADSQVGGDARQLAVLSGPGSVWLQSVPSRSIPPSHDLGL